MTKSISLLRYYFKRFLSMYFFVITWIIIIPVFQYVVGLLFEVIYSYANDVAFCERLFFTNMIFLSSSLFSFFIIPFAFYEIRKTNIYSSLQIFGFSKNKIIVTSCLFIFCFLSISFIYSFLWQLVINYDKLDIIFYPSSFLSTNVFGLILGIIYLMLFLVSVLTMVSFCIKRSWHLTLFCSILFSTFICFSGFSFPAFFLNQNDVLKFISCILPFRYVAIPIQISINENIYALNCGSIFNPFYDYYANIFNAGSHYVIYTSPQIWASYFVSPISSIIFSAISLKFSNTKLWKS